MWASRVKQEVLERVFNALDVDGNGVISEQEFREWFADFKSVWRSAASCCMFLTRPVTDYLCFLAPYALVWQKRAQRHRN